MTDHEWVKLEKANDWGRDYWALPGEALQDGTARAERGLKLEHQRLTVKWPEGAVTKELILFKTRDYTVHDMGNSYVTQCPVYFVRKNISGIEADLGIDELLFSKAEILKLGAKP